MYSRRLLALMKRKHIQIMDRVRIEQKGSAYEGILLPRAESGDPEVLLLKLDNGYNIGIALEKGDTMTKMKTQQKQNRRASPPSPDPAKPTIAILHTGGTIASKVDYRIGGVASSFLPEDLMEMVPELFAYANIRTRLIRNMNSEDMRVEHHQLLAREVAREVRSGADGIIIGHGTDTLHYTAAALSFMLDNVPVPVILIGAQRSSDRGSSDAAMNVICAARLITRSDFAGVAICMHETMNDETCVILPGTNARKMHTSRRDAFRAINTTPYARVWYTQDKIAFLRSPYPKRGKRTMVVRKNMEPKVALLKMYPGFDPGVMDYYLRGKYKGLVIEGTGLGQAPVTEVDEFTRPNQVFFQKLKQFISRGGLVVMTSQCIWGRVHMHVYSPAVRLRHIGVIPGEDMTPETAYIKLSWLLGNYPAAQAKELVRQNMRGEISPRTPLGQRSPD